jgi:hypothetical protein
MVFMATATNAVAQGYDSGTAFTEGRALGSGSINGAFQGIGSGNAASMVPGYGQSATQTQLFQGWAGAAIWTRCHQGYGLR